MRRRSLLAALGPGAGALALTGAWPGLAPAAIRPGRTLVLVEFNGGNDGLNTVVPYRDPLYYRLRPTLAVPPEEVATLDGRLGLNPAMAPLMPAWEAGELAIVLGVGYPQPDRSHFRSIEIWDTASDSAEIRQEGWAASVLSANRGASRDPVDGVVMGRPYPGPLLGERARVLVMENPRDFAQQARRLPAVAERGGGNALDHILRVQREARAAADTIAARMATVAPDPGADFPKTSFGGQMANAARLIISGLDVPAIKLALPGFDTHTYQRRTHDRLLGEFADAAIAFRAVLMRAGCWDRVVLATYSEFGRRPAENTGFGTDHGTAAPVFLLGKSVRGGFHGQQPALDRLRDGDLVHGVDFRRVFATLARRWWDVDPGSVFPAQAADMPLIA